jgi:hypothetical protein
MWRTDRLWLGCRIPQIPRSTREDSTLGRRERKTTKSFTTKLHLCRSHVAGPIRAWSTANRGAKHEWNAKWVICDYWGSRETRIDYGFGWSGSIREALQLVLYLGIHFMIESGLSVVQSVFTEDMLMSNIINSTLRLSRVNAIS